MVPTDHDPTKVGNPSRKNRNVKIKTGKLTEKSTAYELFPNNQPEGHSPPCYNSKRREFPTDYQENLEKCIADMEFNDNDSQSEAELKFRML
jgi:hypothetical protein